MQNTLPLFEEVSDQELDQARSEVAAADSAAVARDGYSGSNRHLQAARRLSRGIRRYPDRSAEQTRAGLAICRHLQALLAQSEPRSEHKP